MAPCVAPLANGAAPHQSRAYFPQKCRAGGHPSRATGTAMSLPTSKRRVATAADCGHPAMPGPERSAICGSPWRPLVMVGRSGFLLLQALAQQAAPGCRHRSSAFTQGQAGIGARTGGLTSLSMQPLADEAAVVQGILVLGLERQCRLVGCQGTVQIA